MVIPTLEGKLIRLRKLRRSDAPSIHRLADNADIARYLPRLPFPYTMKEANRWITATARLARQDKSYNFGIADNENDEIAGMIGLRNLNRRDGNAEIGYWVGRPYQARGYASEAIRLTLEFAFEVLRLVRVYAVVHQRNAPSVRVLEKTGFMREGTWRKASFMGGRWSDVYAYGILKEEFPRGKDLDRVQAG